MTLYNSIIDTIQVASRLAIWPRIQGWLFDSELPCQRECSNPHICKFVPFKCEAKCSEQVLVRNALLLGLM